MARESRTRRTTKTPRGLRHPRTSASASTPKHVSADLLGNAALVERLRFFAAHDLPSHAFLFTGPRGTGKRALSLAFAQALCCLNQKDGRACQDCASCASLSYQRHPDVTVIEAEDGGSIGIASIRDALDSTSTRPLIGRRRIMLLFEADRLTEEAANALLKSLEEPRGETVMILTTENPSSLPATIQSRCAIFTVRLLPAKELEQALGAYGLTPSEAKSLAAFTDGRAEYASWLAQHPDALESAINDSRLFVEIISRPLHQRFATADELSDDVKRPERARQLFERWESTARRILRISLGFRDAGPFHEQLAALSRRVSPATAQSILDSLAAGRRILATTSNPRIALESLFLHLPDRA